jgi:hypothetical protein
MESIRRREKMYAAVKSAWAENHWQKYKNKNKKSRFQYYVRLNYILFLSILRCCSSGDRA